MPAQPLLVELYHDLRTLHVRLPGRHQVRLVTPLPLDEEHQLPRAVRGPDDPLRLEAPVEAPRPGVLPWVRLLTLRLSILRV